LIAGDFCCLGILLDRCQLPRRPCPQCWFRNDRGEPTLVSVTVFAGIQESRKGDRDYGSAARPAKD
jgi:hypothetical protein